MNVSETIIASAAAGSDPASASFIVRLLAMVAAGIFTQNFVLNRFLGICPVLGVSKRLGPAVGMGVAVTAVMLMATALTYPVYALLAVNGLEFLRTLVFILIIASLVQLLEVVLKKRNPDLHQSLGVYLPLITTNCAVLGVTILVTDGFFGAAGYSFWSGYLAAIFTAAGGGLGFLAAMVMFAGVRERLEDSDIPKSLRGAPITLIAAAIVAMSFLGFAGLVG